MGAAIGVVGAVFGGAGGLLGGGGLLGQLLGGLFGGNAEGIGKAMSAFSPPNVLNAAHNLLSSMMGGGLNQAARTLHREDGMPKFIQDAIEKAVEKVLKQQNKPTEGAVQSNHDDAAGSNIAKQIEDIAKQIVESVRRQMTESTEEAGKQSGGGAKKGARSWLQAIAQAMGEAMGNKAAKMVELSNKLKEQSTAGGDEKAQAKAAKEMQATNAEFQAVSQEFKLLTDAFSTALKSLGEGMGSMARKT